MNLDYTHSIQDPIVDLQASKIFKASQKSSDPKVTRKLFGQTLTKNFHLFLQLLWVPLDSRSGFFV